MNSGKIFENEIKDSVKDYNKKKSDDFYILRLTDSASGFNGKQEGLRFSAKSPFDFLIWKRNRILYFVELKSTAGTSISFSLENDNKEIKKSQIENLRIANKYEINSGFVLNFRKYPITYYVDIENFDSFAKNTTKKSINLSDVESNGGILIPQKLKKIRYVYDINVLFEENAK